MHLLDEARQADGRAEVAEGDAVDREAREVVDGVDEGMQVVLCRELDLGRWQTGEAEDGGGLVFR